MTPEQREAADLILNALRDYQHAHQYPPSLRELCALTHYSLSALAHRLDQMERAGLIYVERKQARGIRVL